MADLVREWVTIAVPGKSRKRWQIDVTYMLSSYRCIFGCGCQGILTEPTPELSQGCCSYGAHADDDDDRKNVEKQAKKLLPEEWQFHEIGAKKGVWAKVGKDGYRTRLVDDACIFLNRPGFHAGPGCALHLLALRKDVHFSETKPTVCWQVPLRAVPKEEDDASDTWVLTEFARDGWGEGGDDFAWWCTEDPAAFTGGEPVYKSMEPEIRLMVGNEVYDLMSEYLDRRMATDTRLPHPSEVPVTLGKRITRPLPHNFG